MKIVAISDTHGQHEKLSLPKGDMIIHAGDISRMGKPMEISVFLSWYSQLDYKYKIFIAGNHDFYFESDPINARNLIPEGIIYLENELIEIEGKRIYGSPITPKFYNWAFNRERGYEIREVWRNIPEGLDVLITHGPPMRILDQNVYGSFCGCLELRDIVFRVTPKFHVCGHIHNGFGIFKQDEITFINASVLNDHYELTNKASTFELACDSYQEIPDSDSTY